MTGSEWVVMFDIDGGVADLSAFTHLLTAANSDGSRRQAWQRFFDNVGQAAVVEACRDVVEAVAGLGFVVVYSTIRPVSYAEQTRMWLGENGFTPGRALLCRARGDHRTAVEVKAGHCRAVGRWLSAFVDDEPETRGRIAVPRGAGALLRGAVRAAGAEAARHADRWGRWEADRSQDAPTTRSGRRGAPHRRRSTLTQGED
ncbi:hypothetical protein [Rhodococcus opacus]|uniref:hypothetical protein n=1 Tax=Rhodococcus opacus TaxID=37919 RepID=UPI0020167E3A